MPKLRSILLLAWIVSLAAFAVIGLALVLPLYISTDGNIVGYELILSEPKISWGDVELGIPVTRTLTIENIGDRPSPTLAMSVESVDLPSYTLTWDYDREPINPGQTKTVKFTLTVIEAPLGPFTFDIKIDRP